MSWDWQSDLKELRKYYGEDVVAPFRDEFDFLSNFYIISGGMTFAGFHVSTAEHAFQMMKTLNLEDRKWIATQPTAKLAKQAAGPNGLNGRKIELRSDWEKVKYPIMLQVVTAKFFQNFGLAKRLLATDNRRIVELNWWHDVTWGWCLADGGGENNLGIILEHVRQLLKDISVR
jgi:ribA/ribD-fused uncharacterized protein